MILWFKDYGYYPYWFQGVLGDRLPGKMNKSRFEKYHKALDKCHDDQAIHNFRIVVIRDEYTGHRYGKAKCRIGKCTKIGSGGRNKNSKTQPYQIWADWSEDN